MGPHSWVPNVPRGGIRAHEEQPPAYGAMQSPATVLSIGGSGGCRRPPRARASGASAGGLGALRPWGVAGQRQPLALDGGAVVLGYFWLCVCRAAGMIKCGDVENPGRPAGPGRPQGRCRPACVPARRRVATTAKQTSTSCAAPRRPAAAEGLRPSPWRGPCESRGRTDGGPRHNGATS